ncbi:MAG TPA: PepSY domain-containing protein [Chthoniobacterales bacterium]|nr:PepSY domain-containing protein [Chthoniobacterales bacterium]
MRKIVAAISIAIIGSLACPVFLTAAEENEQTVKMTDLPAAVQTTIKDKAGSNKIVKIEKKTEEGKTVYEAVVNKKGKEWSIEVDANGKFLKQYQESKEKEEKGEKY